MQHCFGLILLPKDSVCLVSKWWHSESFFRTVSNFSGITVGPLPVRIPSICLICRRNFMYLSGHFRTSFPIIYCHAITKVEHLGMTIITNAILISTDQKP